MDNSEFRKEAHKLVDWMADYLENISKYPVKPDVKPGDIKDQLTLSPPENNESFNKIFSWQSLSFKYKGVNLGKQ